jgi:hypothetical protein
MRARTIIALLLFLTFLSCAHPNRVSRSTVTRLTKHRETFVLVFGSMLPAQGATERPMIRFVHHADKTAPEYVLHEMKISNGDRFYAVLKAPSELKYVDQFETEVSWADAYDKISFVRIAQQHGPVAMYLGEIQMTLAERRNAPGRGISVTVRDEFQNATRELHQLYPGFDGEIIKAPLLRNPVPAAAPPKRVAP